MVHTEQRPQLHDQLFVTTVSHPMDCMINRNAVAPHFNHRHVLTTCDIFDHCPLYSLHSSCTAEDKLVCLNPDDEHVYLMHTISADCGTFVSNLNEVAELCHPVSCRLAEQCYCYLFLVFGYTHSFHSFLICSILPFLTQSRVVYTRTVFMITGRSLFFCLG